MTSRPGAVSRDNFEWDSEGRIRRHLLGTNERTRYDYDAEGRRVRKVEATGNTVYVYDGDGNLAAEYGGAALAGIRYVTVDHLGSTRMTTNAAGAEVERIDYLPFGEELTVSAGQSREGVAGFGSAVGVRQRFTGKERDGETGLDYFRARYFSGVQGRFTSPDAPLADQNVSDPQSWNLYGYVRNSPLRHVDDNGAGAREAAQGVWQGTKNFASNTVTGLANLASGLVTDPVGTVGGVVSDLGDTLSLAGKTYFTSEGRAGLATSFGAMSDEERGAIFTESLLVGASAVLGPKVFKGSGATAQEASLAARAAADVAQDGVPTLVEGCTAAGGRFE